VDVLPWVHLLKKIVSILPNSSHIKEFFVLNKLFNLWGPLPFFLGGGGEELMFRIMALSPI
jgi:hypothetical protein